MTVIDITQIVPLKAKAWVGLFVSLLAFAAPYAVEASTDLPPAVSISIGLFLAAATALGVYKAPYKPAGTTLALDPTVPVATQVETQPSPSPYQPPEGPPHALPSNWNDPYAP